MFHILEHILDTGISKWAFNLNKKLFHLKPKGNGKDKIIKPFQNVFIVRETEMFVCHNFNFFIFFNVMKFKLFFICF